MRQFYAIGSKIMIRRAVRIRTHDFFKWKMFQILEYRAVIAPNISVKTSFNGKMVDGIHLMLTIILTMTCLAVCGVRSGMSPYVHYMEINGRIAMVQLPARHVVIVNMTVLLLLQYVTITMVRLTN